MTFAGKMDSINSDVGYPVFQKKRAEIFLKIVKRNISDPAGILTDPDEGRKIIHPGQIFFRIREKEWGKAEDGSCAGSEEIKELAKGGRQFGFRESPSCVFCFTDIVDPYEKTADITVRQFNSPVFQTFEKCNGSKSIKAFVPEDGILREVL